MQRVPTSSRLSLLNQRKRWWITSHKTVYRSTRVACSSQTEIVRDSNPAIFLLIKAVIINSRISSTDTICLILKLGRTSPISLGKIAGQGLLTRHRGWSRWWCWPLVMVSVMTIALASASVDLIASIDMCVAVPMRSIRCPTFLTGTLTR